MTFYYHLLIIPILKPVNEGLHWFIFISTAVLSDFEDASNHLDDKIVIREINLVADSLRLGGAILGTYIIGYINGYLLGVIKRLFLVYKKNLHDMVSCRPIP